MDVSANNYPPGWHAYVRRHLQDTAGYVVAQSGTCLSIKDQEATGPRNRVPNRTFRAMDPADLVHVLLPKSWFMGIILCPGDDLGPILRWMKGLAKADHDRVVLYVHPGFDQKAGAERLRAASLEHLRKSDFKGSWENFHRLFGNDYSWQVWIDKA